MHSESAVNAHSALSDCRVNSLCIHCALTANSLRIHCTFTVHSPCIHCALSVHSLCIHCAFHTHSREAQKKHVSVFYEHTAARAHPSTPEHTQAHPSTPQAHPSTPRAHPSTLEVTVGRRKKTKLSLIDIPNTEKCFPHTLTRTHTRISMYLLQSISGLWGL